MSKAINKIIVYENQNFSGLSAEFSSDVPDLRSSHFNDCISSLKVIGQPWVLFEHGNFHGNLYEFEEGEYPTIPMNDGATSMKLITDDLEDPKITIYSEDNYGGKSIVCTKEQNLIYGSFNDVASSHMVQKGAWILYEHSPDTKEGKRLLARAGEKIPQYIHVGFSDMASYVRPLLPGRPIVTYKVLWDQMTKGHETASMIDQVIGVNHSDREQSFSTEHMKEYEGSVSYELKCSNTTTVRAGTQFDVKFVSVELSLETSFTFEKGKTESTTTRESVSINLPAVIPPHTKLYVNVMRKTSKMTVPVQLTIERGGKKKTECATLVCDKGNVIYTEFKSEKL
uniref:Epidermal differentiation-specific protein-like n=1 Tax=Geotrypetes seraphini TaxID=260995 RepID=A0A6P8NSY5_GEOSA|nr:epidermal differentiation-specific protein-like [Geotrypetes seraphini]